MTDFLIRYNVSKLQCPLQKYNKISLDVQIMKTEQWQRRHAVSFSVKMNLSLWYSKWTYADMYKGRPYAESLKMYRIGITLNKSEIFLSSHPT